MSSFQKLQEQYDLLDEKIHRLRKALILETDAAVKFKLEKQIEAAEQERKELEWKRESRERLINTCPYRGLFAFREEDERFFFGRDAYSAKLLDAVQSGSFVALVGASGSGKSSLVYAGLIPALRRQGKWLMTSFRPREHPFQALANALIAFLYSDELERLAQGEKLATQLQAGEIDLSHVIERSREKHKRGANFLLFVDQFEELYTLCRNNDERRRFLDDLLAAQTPDCNIVLTLRADFLGKALAYRPFADALQHSSIVLGPMNRDELRASVKCPAKLLEVDIEDGLSERILDALGDKPGNLPLLEFALRELWEKQSVGNGGLTHAAYDEIGGVEQALALYAEGVYNALTPEEKSRARHIFTQLVRPGEGTEDTRRVAVRADVGEESWELVVRLANERLIVTNQNNHAAGGIAESQQAEDTFEVVHEALIQRWRRLRDWLDEDREFRVWQERLRAVIPPGKTSYGDGELLRGSALSSAADWLRTRRDDLSRREQEFIEQSQRTQQRAQRRKEAERNKALKTQSLFLADLARQQNEQSYFTRAILLGLEAMTKDMAQPERPYVAEAEFQLYEAATRQQERYILQGHKNFVFSAQFSPDGCRIVTASKDGTARIWNVTDGQELAVLCGHKHEVLYAEFSPDGGYIVTASKDQTARVWDAASGKVLAVLRGYEGDVLSAAFSPNGCLIVTVSNDYTMRVWDAFSGNEFALLCGHEAHVFSAAFSPDGRRIVTASEDHTARVWDAASGKVLAVLRGHKDSVYSAAFSSNVQHIVTAAWDNTARVWFNYNLKSSIIDEASLILKGHEDIVLHAAFSPDGRRIVTASKDKTARVWDVDVSDDKELAVLRGHTAHVHSAAFSPDGHHIITAAWDNTARVWDVVDDAFNVVLYGHEGNVCSADFSPDGHHIVTASWDGTAHVWNASDGDVLAILRGHEDWVKHAAFSPDGRRIVTASSDKTAYVWDAGSDKALAVLRGHEDWLNSAEFSPDGLRIVTASKDKTARVWDVASGDELTVLRVQNGTLYSAAFSPDGCRIVTASSFSTACVWDAVSGKAIAELCGHDAMVNSAVFSTDGRRIVTASLDCTARVWDAASGDELAVLRGHGSDVFSGVFSPDGRLIVTASQDKTARVWDVASGDELAVLHGHYGMVNFAAFSPNGRCIVTAARDNTACVWDAASGKIISVLRGHKNHVNHAAFSPDGCRIVTASLDGTARVWRAFPSTQELIEFARAQLPPQHQELTEAEKQHFFLAD